MSKKQPAWKQAQQKQTKPEKAQQRVQAGEPNHRMIKMRTSYRHFAKAGDVWETDESKAAELVKLGRAEYVETPKKAAKKADEAPAADAGEEGSDEQ